VNVVLLAYVNELATQPSARVNLGSVDLWRSAGMPVGLSYSKNACNMSIEHGPGLMALAPCSVQPRARSRRFGAAATARTWSRSCTSLDLKLWPLIMEDDNLVQSLVVLTSIIRVAQGAYEPLECDGTGRMTLGVEADEA
jgi:hypothetical protein